MFINNYIGSLLFPINPFFGLTISEMFGLSHVCLIVVTLARLSNDNIIFSVLGVQVAVKAMT